jgi:iron(III) transport system substrate-binding protein
MSKEQGSVSAMKKAPYYPEGFDPKAARLWLPNFEQYEKLRASWVEEWNKTFGYRQ